MTRKSIYQTPTEVIKCEVEDNVFEGQSIEEKVRRITTSNEAIEAISPMIYQERKEGIKSAYDIRADKFEIAQAAMDSIATGTRQKRNERMKTAETKATETKPTE